VQDRALILTSQHLLDDSVLKAQVEGGGVCWAKSDRGSSTVHLQNAFFEKSARFSSFTSNF
jgi:hypothetical protein